MNEKIEKLNSLSEIILTENHPGKLRSTCRELYDFFCEIAELDENKEDERTHDGTILSQGKAISPLNAARCLWEYKRTSQFLRGISAAIDELKKRFPNEKLEILYAGCGPFASLVTPLLGKFAPAEINLTLLDYHDFSIAAAQKIFRAFDLEKFNAEFIKTDACTYTSARKIHLVISETMQNALVNETQTAITLNLASQLYERGIFVPQKISVAACAANLGKEFAEKERILLGEILSLDTEKVRQTGANDFPPVSFKIPAEAKQKSLDLMILTEIQIFDSFRLSDYESSISLPKRVRPFPDLSRAESVEFSYILDEKPRFEHRIEYS